MPGWSWVLLKLPLVKFFQLLYKTGPNNVRLEMRKTKLREVAIYCPK